MGTKQFFYFALFIGFFGLVSCDEDDDSNNDFANGTGIDGRVLVQNEFQQPLYDERDGIEVFLEVGFQDYTLSADQVGKYILGSAPVGNYTATYSKEGYGSVIASGIKVSNTSPELPVYNGYQRFPSVTITKLPETVFSNLSMDLNTVEVTNGLGDVIDTLYTLTIDASMVPPPPPTGHTKGYRLFLGTDDMVSPDIYVSQMHYTSTTEEIQVVLYDDWFNANNIQSGDVIWAALYGDSNFDFTQTLQDGTVLYPNISQDVGALGSAVLP